MANEKLFHVGAKALITNDRGEVLVLKADPSRFLRKTDEAHWDIPGGRVQQGGDIKQTLAREIAEETGVTDISDVTFLSAVVSNIEIPISDTQQVGLILMIYSVSIPAGSRIVLSEENTEYAWVSKPEAAVRLAFKYPPEFIDILNSPVKS
ncbi:MAG TPA: NUDIX domain-containing protein [Candidatus Saccharimonadales bacterium]|jgi:8-oxo-dGTP pyrophosphatase MutT (NUDIX family)